MITLRNPHHSIGNYSGAYSRVVSILSLNLEGALYNHALVWSAVSASGMLHNDSHSFQILH